MTQYYFDNYGWFTLDEWPGRFTEQRPPSMATPTNIGKQRAKWENNTWTLEKYVPPTEDDFLAMQKQLLKERATELRWIKETQGKILPNGARIGTTQDDQIRLGNVVKCAPYAQLEEFDFKAESGWITVSLTELEQIVAVVALHVQQCFSTERLHHLRIDALTRDTVESYDVEAGWPE